MSRWRRSIHNLSWFAERANRFWVFDNSDSDPDVSPLLIAEGRDGSVTLHVPDAIPEVTAALSDLTIGPP